MCQVAGLIQYMLKYMYVDCMAENKVLISRIDRHKRLYTLI